MQCSKCNAEMERRKHRPNETAHLLKPYYFAEWDYCKNCGHVQHYEKFKIVNQTPKVNGMPKERKVYSRYIFNRGLQTLWKGDAAVAGSKFRSIAITSDDFNSTQETFQVFALEGIGSGVKDGKFVRSEDEPTTLFDEDFKDLDAAAKKFGELVNHAEKQGFKRITFIDILEYEEKARQSKK